MCAAELRYSWGGPGDKEDVPCPWVVWNPVLRTRKLTGEPQFGSQDHGEVTEGR